MSVKELNFARAEYGEPTPLDHCAWCSRGIAGEFFHASGSLICPVCAARARDVLPRDTPVTFRQSAARGLAAAIAASLLYLLLFRFMTDHGLGMGTAFGAIGVGYVIAKIMRTAGPAARGRRYQITAAVLTYAAITVALTSAIFGASTLPAWGYLLLPLGPFLLLFVGRFQLAIFLLLFAGIGIRWAWVILTPLTLKITGPFGVAAPSRPSPL
jgi:hypothetical protein